jgi:hypothetical protein
VLGNDADGNARCPCYGKLEAAVRGKKPNANHSQ